MHRSLGSKQAGHSPRQLSAVGLAVSSKEKVSKLWRVGIGRY
jgi:hypothetical protein